jgi:hypothetical protein
MIIKGFSTAADIFRDSIKIETDIIDGRHADGISKEKIEERLDTVVEGKLLNVADNCRSRAAHLR